MLSLVHLARSRMYSYTIYFSFTHICYRIQGNKYIRAGRHFGRTVSTMCTVRVLITNAIVRAPRLRERSIEEFSLQYV